MGIDPRVVRTRRRLGQALLELIGEVGYDAITIEQLAERADVARSTFYAHYGHKDDLLFAGFVDWLLSFAREAAGSRDLAGGEETAAFHFRFSLPLLRHARHQAGFFQSTIVRGSGDRVRRRLTAEIASAARTELEWAGRLQVESAAAEARGRAVAGAFVALLEWAFGLDRPWDPEELDRVFQATVAGSP